MKQMKIVKGEQALKELMQRMRPGQEVVMIETQGWCGDIHVRLHYYRDKNDPDDGYRLFYVLTLDHPQGWVNDADDADEIALYAVEGGLKHIINGERREQHLLERYPNLPTRIKQLTW